jgi:predicted chitinase
MAQDDASKIKIPDTPPPGSGATQGAIKGIAALKKAMADVGFESPYAVAAILAIAGGESKWIPQEEKKYTQKNLLSLGINAADAAKYGRPDISKQEFFGWFYGIHKKYGVPQSANYFGRGFIQLTFLDNYKRYAKLSGLDLVNHPELLSDTSDEGYAACAKVCALYLADRVCKVKGKWNDGYWKTEQWKPTFLELALNAVGGVQDGWPKKRQYYK